MEGKLTMMPSSKGDQSEDRSTLLLLGIFLGTRSNLGVLGINRAEAGVLGITGADFGGGKYAILKASKFLVASISAWFPEKRF